MEGEILDDATGKPQAALLSIRGSDGRWHFPKSASSAGSAVRDERRSDSASSAIATSTSLSAHPFRVELLPGRYTFTIEHGKESETREVVVEKDLPKLTFRLRR